MKRTLFPLVLLLFTCHIIFAQSEEYTKEKAEKLSVESPFTKIINRELPASIELEYEDEEIIAFIPLREQSPVHLLIVPKKRIPTINDLEEEDASVFHIHMHLLGGKKLGPMITQ
jgi:histidine triad (HIT) family protein